MRQSIIDVVKSALQQISTANGYRTDFGALYSEWVCYSDLTQVNALQIRDEDCAFETESEADDNAMADHTKTLTININILVASKTAGTILRQVISDVYKAIGVLILNSVTDGYAGTLKLPQYVKDVKPGGDRLMVTEDNRKIGGSQVTILITYKTAAWTD